MTTPGSSDQPPQDPAQGWGQQPPGGQPGQNQPPAGQSGSWQPPAGASPAGPPQQFGQPGQPWAGQPGQPQQPGQPWGGQPGFGQAPPQKSGFAKLLPIIAGVVALIVVAVLAFTFLGGPSAEVGDCTNDSLSEIGVVDCDSGEAAFRIVKVVEDTTQAELTIGTVCTDDFPDTAAYAFEGDESGGEGTGYCLQPVS